MRTEFKLTPEQKEKLLDASEPTPVMKIGNCIIPGPQENANCAWQDLADELGFVWHSVKPVPGKSDTYFSAIHNTL